LSDSTFISGLGHFRTLRSLFLNISRVCHAAHGILHFSDRLLHDFHMPFSDCARTF
jgi:hypothetical protein